MALAPEQKLTYKEAGPAGVAAFEAASFLMDYLKTRAPFWKREHLVDGTTGGWVEAAEADDAAAARWVAILGDDAPPEG